VSVKDQSITNIFNYYEDRGKRRVNYVNENLLNINQHIALAKFKVRRIKYAVEFLTKHKIKKPNLGELRR